jgi:DNA-binding transcriptional MerR regulator
VVSRNLMPIGRFAPSCRLSVKALRHYDRLGLLKPAFVDPQSHYRYYSRDQVRDALMISMLRSLELPLTVIREALAASPQDLKAILDAQTVRIEVEVAARQRTLMSLRHIAEAGVLTPREVAILAYPERLVARLEGTTDAHLLIGDSTRLIYALLDEMRGLQIEFRSVFTITTPGESEDRIEMCACVELDHEPSQLRIASFAQLAGGPFACLTHTGPYETLGLAHHALHAWVQERGHEPLGPVWEFYGNDPAEVPAQELRTEVALPLRTAADPQARG